MRPAGVLRLRSMRSPPPLSDGTRPMAALALADELSEVKEKLQRLEPELAKLQEASVLSADRVQATQAAVVAALNAAAERIESLTRRLNQTLVDASVPMG